MTGGRGFSLIELITVIAIAAILTSAMWPPITAMLERSRGTTSINWIVTGVHLARHTAINRRVTVTLCAIKEGSDKCGGLWHDGLLVFTDRNRNAIIDQNDAILAKIQPPHRHGTITWRAFKNKSYLQLTPTGMTNYQNGNWVYCPLDQNVKFARQIIVNASGRVRLVHSRDNAGYPIDRFGKLLKC